MNESEDQKRRATIELNLRLGLTPFFGLMDAGLPNLILWHKKIIDKNITRPIIAALISQPVDAANE